MITLIAAVARNNVIGGDNKLLWHIPADLKFFKQATLGKPIIMGRKTHESIGRALPQRLNIVITRQGDYQPLGEGVVVKPSLTTAIEHAKITAPTEIIIGGGAEIYQQAMALANKLLITHIDKDYEGDTYFPPIGSEWEIVREELNPATADTPAFRWSEYRRV